MKGFAELTNVDVAREKFFNLIDKPKFQRKEKVPLMQSIWRVLAEDIVSQVNIPPFDRAAMDGYAVKAENTFGASTTSPIQLKIVGAVDIGDTPTVTVHDGEAVRINTGAPMPPGANAVVMAEYTEKISENILEIYQTVTPNKNLAKAGEDVKKGDVVAKKGTIICPQDIALFHALGIEEVTVWQKLKVAVFSTGDELVEEYNNLSPAKIVDSNRPLLKFMLQRDGAEFLDMGIVPDDKDELKKTLLKAIEQADIIVTSGGTSVGTKDYLPLLVSELGSPGIVIHGVNITPGRPVALGKIKEKPLIILPGYPVAAFLNYNLFVRPLIHYLMDSSYRWQPYEKITAKMATRISSRPGVREFVRVKLEITKDNEVLVHPIRRRGAGILSSVTKADALLVIPEDSEGYDDGEEVIVELLRYK